MRATDEARLDPTRIWWTFTSSRSCRTRGDQLVTFASGDPAFAGQMKMTWLLAPDTDGTQVTIRCEDVPPGITAEDHAAGLASSLDHLGFRSSPRFSPIKRVIA